MILPQERGSICLRILYYILQEHAGATVNWDLNDESVRAVYNTTFAFSRPGNDEPGIPQHVLGNLDEIRESYLASENGEGDGYADPGSV